ncbi:MAG: biotin--[acetyl-CoA-carboxylase] ligase [Bacteroides sp.]|nr:biotin--[acetyl-CoA-carboxylase] ligase [Roseburia sp.]MCM1346328.1 biotin--[acetyl-CoA-carboxylase] ligase [Bacteroides sp.]MCM1420917.1 biotin--[acetyl-CoA-carboxylase] ligase [Bacteroides sp.]
MLIEKRIHLETIGSTNSYARQLLASGERLPGMTLIDADDQTAGRGQAGNSWETKKDCNLMFTIVCHPTFLPPARQFNLSKAFALGLQQVLSAYADDIAIKWPNDIYWCDMKISGTLIECDLTGKAISNCIIGCGININQKEFVSDAPNPVSLSMITGKEYDREQILDEVVERFLYFYDLLEKGHEEMITALYMRHLYRGTGIHLFQDHAGIFEAEIADIEPTGHLVLRKNPCGTLLRYEFKEVRFVLNHACCDGVSSSPRQ